MKFQLLNGTILTPIKPHGILEVTAHEMKDAYLRFGVQQTMALLAVPHSEMHDWLVEQAYGFEGILLNRGWHKTEMDFVCFDGDDDPGVDDKEALRVWFRYWFPRQPSLDTSVQADETTLRRLAIVGTVCRMVMGRHALMLDLLVASDVRLVEKRAKTRTWV